MQGKIIKGIAGFYYVHLEGRGIFECKAKGIFRNNNIKPLVGDNVEIDLLDEEKFLGNITEILPRKNELIRPAVANVDQAMLFFAITNPKPNFNLLDRFLIMMDKQQVETILCFNKIDLAGDEQIADIRNNYDKCGCKLFFFSLHKDDFVEATLKPLLSGKTTVLAGPSGVGKSSLTNRLTDSTSMQVGAVSEKIGRGKHTTRHSEILNIGEGTYLVDTPGFTSFYVSDIESSDLHFYQKEFEEYEGKCRFNGCVHVNEPDCMVKSAVKEGKISKLRYDNYVDIFNELKEQRKY